MKPRTPVQHLTDARMSVDAASREICSIKNARIVQIWRELGKVTGKLIVLRNELDALFSAPTISDSAWPLVSDFDRAHIEPCADPRGARRAQAKAKRKGGSA